MAACDGGASGRWGAQELAEREARSGDAEWEGKALRMSEAQTDMQRAVRTVWGMEVCVGPRMPIWNGHL